MRTERPCASRQHTCFARTYGLRGVFPTYVAQAILSWPLANSPCAAGKNELQLIPASVLPELCEAFRRQRLFCASSVDKPWENGYTIRNLALMRKSSRVCDAQRASGRGEYPSEPLPQRSDGFPSLPVGAAGLRPLSRRSLALPEVRPARGRRIRGGTVHICALCPSADGGLYVFRGLAVRRPGPPVGIRNKGENHNDTV